MKSLVCEIYEKEISKEKGEYCDSVFDRLSTAKLLLALAIGITLSRQSVGLETERLGFEDTSGHFSYSIAYQYMTFDL